MNRVDAEIIITEYLKLIFGFTLKRCRNIHDAEDLSQEIVARAFKALLIKDDIVDVRKFIWTVAHNALNNYYRDTAKSIVGIPVDEVAELIADTDYDDNAEAINRLRTEIAYLSKLQRKIIIAYYFENKKQADISRSLGIPLGTVKWHLFEAKKELKRGINTVRKASELKFNPIKFSSIGINGNSGRKSLDEFLHSALSQNICYSVRNTAKSVNEIADDLGVSPVYVESECERLEEYGLMKLQKDKYIVNFIISEPTAELLTMQDRMYKRASELFANDLYDELISSGILDSSDIICNQTDEPVSLTNSPKADRNFLLWSLIPYIAACSGERLIDKRVSFEEVATIHPDGGNNIVHAAVVPDDMNLPSDYVHMNNWCGPMWNCHNGYMLWQIDSEWSDRGEYNGFQIQDDAERVLSLYEREEEDGLSKDEYAWLAERGYVKTNGDYGGNFKASWQVVIIENTEMRDKLLAMGERIKIKYKDEFDALKAPYAKAVLETVPRHLRKIKEYELQFTYHSDGWFLLHCVHALLENGKLKPPTKGQRKAQTILIVKL